MKVTISAKHLLLFASLTLIGGVFGGYLAEQNADKNSPALAIPRSTYLAESAIIDAVNTVSPSVVTIIATRDLPLYQNRALNFDDRYYEDLIFGESENVVSGGSGVTISSNGLVLTNNHVIDEPSLEYSVITKSGQTFKVTSIQADQLHDIAILRLTDETGESPNDLPFATLGDSDVLQVGQYVIAIGNALAKFSNTVTAGVVSALGRSITADDFGGADNLLNLIQTDASIHLGNSGGPLIDLNGRVIGINTAIATNADGIGFAIPTNDIRPLLNEMQVQLN